MRHLTILDQTKFTFFKDSIDLAIIRNYIVTPLMFFIIQNSIWIGHEIGKRHFNPEINTCLLKIA